MGPVSELKADVAALGTQMFKVRFPFVGELRHYSWAKFRADLLAAYRTWGKEQGIGARDLLMPLRIALTSAEHGPELPFVLAALDRETALARLDHILTGTGESTPTPGDQP